MKLPNENQTDVEQLLVMAGPREAMPAARLDRVRAAVHDAWVAETTPRTNTRVVWTLVTAAAAAAVIFTLVRTWPDTHRRTTAEAPARVDAVQITTGPAERKALALSGGGELRVDASSVVTIADDGEIRISSGGVYLDSKGRTLPPVISPAGRITDIGTRFEVRIIGSDTRVRVRVGKVRLAQANSINDVVAAEELLARADGPNESIVRRHVDPFGAEWAWVARAAPRFELEGKSLGNFLDWIETEGGWTVTFATPALERTARATVLHGSIETMSTTEALETIPPACGLTHRVDLKTGRVVVTAAF